MAVERSGGLLYLTPPGELVRTDGRRTFPLVNASRVVADPRVVNPLADGSVAVSGTRRLAIFSSNRSSDGVPAGVPSRRMVLQDVRAAPDGRGYAYVRTIRRAKGGIDRIELLLPGRPRLANPGDRPRLAEGMRLGLGAAVGRRAGAVPEMRTAGRFRSTRRPDHLRKFIWWPAPPFAAKVASRRTGAWPVHRGPMGMAAACRNSLGNLRSGRERVQGLCRRLSSCSACWRSPPSRRRSRRSIQPEAAGAGRPDRVGLQLRRLPSPDGSPARTLRATPTAACSIRSRHPYRLCAPVLEREHQSPHCRWEPEEPLDPAPFGVGVARPELHGGRGLRRRRTTRRPRTRCSSIRPIATILWAAARHRSGPISRASRATTMHDRRRLPTLKSSARFSSDATHSALQELRRRPPRRRS